MFRIKKNRAACCAALMLLFGMALMHCVPAAASQFGNLIDVDAMKNLETSSDFPVRVTEKKVVVECIDVVEIGGDSDVLVFTVENGSADTVSSLTVRFVAYDDEQKTTDITRGLKPIGINSTPNIFTQEKTDISLAPGESTSISTAVSFSLFSGVRAMVESYTTDGGKTVSNPAFEQWQNLAFGLTGGSVTELD